jgi:hypothetical protein
MSNHKKPKESEPNDHESKLDNVERRRLIEEIQRNQRLRKAKEAKWNWLNN